MRPIVLDLGSGDPLSNRAAIERLWPGHTILAVDADCAVRPHIAADLRALPFRSGTVDGVFCNHVLEHFFEHEVAEVLREIYRILRRGSRGLFAVPDLRKAAGLIAQGRATQTYYQSPLGPIRALDMVYGFQAAVQRGEVLMAHRTGFDLPMFKTALERAGFLAHVTFAGAQLSGEVLKE